jgi:hypothetical protein
MHIKQDTHNTVRILNEKLSRNSTYLIKGKLKSSTIQKYNHNNKLEHEF